jgi:hypothetical protein
VGEDTVDVLRDVLGLRADEVEALERDRVIATGPVPSDRYVENAA